MICKLAAFIDKISIAVDKILNVNHDSSVGERRERNLWLSFSRLKIILFGGEIRRKIDVQKQAIK